MASSGPVGITGSLASAPPKPWWTGKLDEHYKKLQNSNQKCVRNFNEKNQKTYLDAQKKLVSKFLT